MPLFGALQLAVNWLSGWQGRAIDAAESVAWGLQNPDRRFESARRLPGDGAPAQAGAFFLERDSSASYGVPAAALTTGWPLVTSRGVSASYSARCIRADHWLAAFHIAGAYLLVHATICPSPAS